MRISYSGLDTFKTCPAKYKFQYLDRIKALKSKEAVFGTLIHDCLKMFHEPSRLSPPLLEDELLQYYTEKWDAGVYQDEREEAFAFHSGIEMLKEYYRQNQGLSFNIVNLETTFIAPILKDKELYQITGRIDRIDKLPDGVFEVIDYKTSKKMPSQEQADKDLQLSVYYLGIANRWPYLVDENRPVKLSLYYLKHGEKLSTVRTSQDISEIKEKILTIISQIKKSDFAPRPNALCDWCSYQPYCPFYKHKFIKPAPDEEQIKEVVNEYFKIKSQQEQDGKKLTGLKELINHYCDGQSVERVFTDQGYITRLPQKRFSYDFIKVKEILEPIGKWNEVLTFNTAKFKKIIDSLPYELKKKIDEAKKLEREFKVITASRSIKKKEPE